jgi:metal-dependent amidase/aminoacylase/carboxypeptidase family protein
MASIMEHLRPQLGQVVDVDHDRVAGKDRCGEEGVGRRIGVGRGAVEDDDLVIAVHCFANGTEHDTTGADSGENERGYRSASQLLVEVSGGEGAHARFADGDVMRFRGEARMKLACRCVSVQRGRRSGPVIRAITLDGGMASKSAVVKATRTQATCPPFARTLVTAAWTPSNSP